MNYKRIGRAMICLLLVCVLLVNASPIKAEASAAALLGPIAGVASVNVPAGLVIGGLAIALGVMAGTNDDFVDMVDYAVDTATDWVKDGTVELLRAVDATGKVAYYAANDLLEDMRSWLFESGALNAPLSFVQAQNVSGSYNSKSYTVNALNKPCSLAAVSYSYYDSSGGEYPYKYYCELRAYTQSSGNIKVEGISGYISLTKAAEGLYYYTLNTKSSSYGSMDFNHPAVAGDVSYLYLGDFQDRASAQAAFKAFNPFVSNVSTDFDLTLGQIHTVPIDGSSALDWSEEYASQRIYVTGGSNDPDPPDENNGKWFWPVALPLTAATLLAMSQADQWSGETPQEFDQYTQNTEFEILNRPEFDGYQAIEIAPVTNPNPNPNPDVGEDPDIGGDSDTDSDAEKTWFQRIVKGIEELPSKFGQWLDKILEWLQKIWEAIISIPQAILEGLKNVLAWAFAPSETFIQSKVESLIAKYPTAETFSHLGHSFRSFFDGLGAQPPIIYIDLGASEGDYHYGGRMAFIDLTWYARYKPTVDAILGAFIWLWVAWRFFVSIPGIISGSPGIFGSPNEKPDTEIHAPRFEVGKNWLNSGSSYHKKGDGGGV